MLGGDEQKNKEVEMSDSNLKVVDAETYKVFVNTNNISAIEDAEDNHCVLYTNDGLQILVNKSYEKTKEQFKEYQKLGYNPWLEFEALVVEFDEFDDD